MNLKKRKTSKAAEHTKYINLEDKEIYNKILVSKIKKLYILKINLFLVTSFLNQRPGLVLRGSYLSL